MKRIITLVLVFVMAVCGSCIAEPTSELFINVINSLGDGLFTPEALSSPIRFWPSLIYSRTDEITNTVWYMEPEMSSSVYTTYLEFKDNKLNTFSLGFDQPDNFTMPYEMYKEVAVAVIQHFSNIGKNLSCEFTLMDGTIVPNKLCTVTDDFVIASLNFDKSNHRYAITLYYFEGNIAVVTFFKVDF